MRHMVWLARLLAFVIAAIGFGVIVGYALKYDPLITVLPGLPGMAILTAITIFTLAVSCLAESWRSVRLADGAIRLAMVLGVISLIEHAFYNTELLSPFIARHFFGWNPVAAGRMSVPTALCTLALALARLHRSRPLIANSAIAVTALISGISILGYAYGVHDFYAVPVFNIMALNTAVSMLGLALTAILLRAETGFFAVAVSDSQAGASTRRKLGLALISPLIAEGLLEITNAQSYGPSAAVAFLVALTLPPLIFLIVKEGQSSLDLEGERQQLAGLQESKARELEDRLAIQAKELQHESDERQKAEEAMYQGQRLDAIGQLTGGIAHDFNNLLMALNGNLQLLQRHLAEDHPAFRYTNNLDAVVQRGTKLTSQLLAFSRTQKLDIKPIEINASLKNARELIGTSLGPEITVTLRPAAAQTWMLTDSDQLELAILNMAINARDAMPDGGALVIEAEADPRGKTIGIRVIDTGEGMQEAVIAKAFEPFFTTKERGKGTGLGLAQVFGFVKQCGGDMRIESVDGSGTTIHMSLPLADEAQPIALPRIEETASIEIAGSGHVMVIDDDDDVRSVIVQSLEALGYDVIEASNGPDGLASLELFRPIVAIIDFIMPGMNGAEVAKRAQQLYPHLPIIFVSGYSDTLALDRVNHAQVLRKPFNIEALHQAVQASQAAPS